MGWLDRVSKFFRPEGRIWDLWEADRTGGLSDAEPIRDEKTLLKWFMDHQSCPDCGSTRFIEGPTGGLSIMYLCDGCHSEFTLALPLYAARAGEPREGRVHLYRVTPRPL